MKWCSQVLFVKRDGCRFAISNLRYVRRFYDLYRNTIRPQLVGETKETYQDDGKGIPDNN